MYSAFGVDHGISKAFGIKNPTGVLGKPFQGSSTVGGRNIQGLKPTSPDRARYLKTSLRNKGKPTSGAQERARGAGVQRMDAIAGRQTHRQNYPESKNIHGFPKRQLP